MLKPVMCLPPIYGQREDLWIKDREMRTEVRIDLGLGGIGQRNSIVGTTLFASNKFFQNQKNSVESGTNTLRFMAQQSGS